MTVNHNEDENDPRTLRQDLYKLKETQVRNRLHQEYLNKYRTENIIPVGLKITNRPTVDRDNDHTRDFKKRRETKIRGYSKELIEMLREYYVDEVEMIEHKGSTIDNKIGELWDEQGKESFDKELTDIFKEDEENIRKLKEKKLKNGRIKANKRNKWNKFTTIHSRECDRIY